MNVLAIVSVSKRGCINNRMYFVSNEWKRDAHIQVVQINKGGK